MHRGAARYSACLLDVFGTAVSVDLGAATAAVATAIDVPVAAWAEALGSQLPLVENGRLDLGAAMAVGLRACGRDDDPATVRQVLAHDRRILAEQSRVEGDVVPFLSELRSRGVATALVSNGAEHTRDLLESTGLLALVDELVLSCEVGAVKPDPSIFRHALAALGADPRTTLLVDDRPDYCRGAMALRIDTVVMSRDGWGPDAAARADGLPSVRSLTELLRRF